MGLKNSFMQRWPSAGILIYRQHGSRAHGSIFAYAARNGRIARPPSFHFSTFGFLTALRLSEICSFCLLAGSP